jgi:hypothetical protein
LTPRGAYSPGGVAPSFARTPGQCAGDSVEDRCATRDRPPMNVGAFGASVAAMAMNELWKGAGHAGEWRQAYDAVATKPGASNEGFSPTTSAADLTPTAAWSRGVRWIGA